MNTAVIKCEVQDYIALVTMDRPPVNAISPQFQDEMGVVEKCVPGAQLMETARALATEIVAKSPIAMRLAKHALNAVEFMTLRDGYRFEQSMTAELSHYEDSQEAMRVFVEKRDPVFTGR